MGVGNRPNNQVGIWACSAAQARQKRGPRQCCFNVPNTRAKWVGGGLQFHTTCQDTPADVAFAHAGPQLGRQHIQEGVGGQRPAARASQAAAVCIRPGPPWSWAQGHSSHLFLMAVPSTPRPASRPPSRLPRLGTASPALGPEMAMALWSSSVPLWQQSAICGLWG